MAEEEEERRVQLLRLMTHLPVVFEKEVLSRLNGTDLKFFARAIKKCRDAVRRAKEDEEAEIWLGFSVEEILSK